MSAPTVPAPESQDAELEAAELVSDLHYPDACRAWTIRRSEKETVREITLDRYRRCTPPVAGATLQAYVARVFAELDAIAARRG